ncbi:MAG: non-canonical purine NTP pyrophosphatase [Alphaproteobacteria bacterium]|nr:non-canonical purine NTP pyrophosphatase [Alphaproteobacteria bacterium]
MIEKIILASANPGKLAEIAEILAPVKVVPYTELFGEFEIAETGETFKENARIKAETISAKTDMPVIADDSGLVIPALDGFPGVRTHEFAIESGGYDAAFAEIEKRLGASDNSAFFVSTIAVAIKGQKTMFATGEIHGTLRFPAAGAGGFGYDPIFVPNGRGCSMAEIDEMEPEFKSQFSHRAVALRKLAGYIAGLNAVAAPVAEEKVEEVGVEKKKAAPKTSNRAKREIKEEEFETAMEAAVETKEND